MSSNCFYCELEHYHPTCNAVGCKRKVHGHGPDGKRVYVNCPDHREEE